MRVSSWTRLAVPLCALALSTNCTVVGFGLGAFADSAQRDKSRCSIASVMPGARITLHLRDGRQERGRFRELVEPDTAAFAARYADWSRSSSAGLGLPALGERVVVSGSRGRSTGAWLGLSPAGVRLAVDGEPAVELARYAQFDLLTPASGPAITSKFLQQLVESSQVPTGTQVRFVPGVGSGGITDFLEGEPRSVAWDDVGRVDIPTDTRWRFVGAITGIILDLMTLAAMLAAGS